MPLSLVRVAIVATLCLCFGCNGNRDNNSNSVGGQNDEETPQRDLAPIDFQKLGNLELKKMQGLPTTIKPSDGIEFQIGKQMLHLGSSEFPQFPKKIAGIQVDQKFQTLHVLQATEGGAKEQTDHPRHEADGVEVGSYLLHYEDGTEASLKIKYGKDLRGWFNWDHMKPTTQGRVVWKGENPEANRANVQIRLYLTSYKNPHPEKKVISIDFLSAMKKAAPFCVALTAENGSEAK